MMLKWCDITAPYWLTFELQQFMYSDEILFYEVFILF